MPLPIAVNYETGNDPPDQYDSFSDAYNLATVTAEAKKTGLYGMQITYDGTNKAVVGTFGSETIAEGFFGMHIYISSNMDLQGTYAFVPIFKILDAATLMLQMGFRSMGTNIPTVWYLSGPVTTETSTTTNFSLGSWHWILIEWIQDVAVGGAQIWVDGTSILNDRDSDTTSYEIDTIQHGSIFPTCTPINGSYARHDNFMGDTSSITEPTDEPAVAAIEVQAIG